MTRLVTYTKLLFQLAELLSGVKPTHARHYQLDEYAVVEVPFLQSFLEHLY